MLTGSISNSGVVIAIRQRNSGDSNDYARHTTSAIIYSMKLYAWNADKNAQLQKERGISFEEVLFHIRAGDEVDQFDHPNKALYPNQKVSVVMIESYAYFVPFVKSETEIFLKTIIPSHKATKKYAGSQNEKT